LRSGSGPDEASSIDRVVPGGWFATGSDNLVPTSTLADIPFSHQSLYGFRCARTP
jgi:hypothetical protein